MEAKEFQIWRQCGKQFAFGTIHYFLNDLKVKKPHLEVQSFQFSETQQLSKKDQQQWIYLKAFDTSLNIYKSLKVQFVDQNSYYENNDKILKQLYSTVTNLQRNDLVLRIYDYDFQYYSYQDVKQPLYFLIEQELVSRNFTSDNLNQLTADQQENLNSFRRRTIDYCSKHFKLTFFKTSTILNSNKAKYYVTKNEDNTHTIKLNPLDPEIFQPLDKFTSLSTNHQKQQCSNQFGKSQDSTLTQQNNVKYPLPQNYVQSGQISNEENDDMESNSGNSSEIQEDEIEEQIIINHEHKMKKQDLITTLLKEQPTIFQTHSKDLFQILSQNSQFDNYSLEEYDILTIIFKIDYQDKQHYLKCERFNNIDEVEKIKHKYEKIQSIQNLGIFIPVKQCEVIHLSEGIYLIYIEEDIEISDKQTIDLDHLSLLFDEFLEINRDYSIRQVEQQLYLYSLRWILETSEQLYDIDLLIPIFFSLQIVILYDQQNPLNSKFYLENPLFKYEQMLQKEFLVNENEIKNKIAKLCSSVKLFIKSQSTIQLLEDQLFQFSCNLFNLKRKQSIKEYPILFKACQTFTTLTDIFRSSSSISLNVGQDFSIELVDQGFNRPIGIDSIKSILSNKQTIIKSSIPLVDAVLDGISEPLPTKEIIVTYNLIQHLQDTSCLSLHKFCKVFENLQILVLDVSTYNYHCFKAAVFSELKILQVVKIRFHPQFILQDDKKVDMKSLQFTSFKQIMGVFKNNQLSQIKIDSNNMLYHTDRRLLEEKVRQLSKTTQIQSMWNEIQIIIKYFENLQQHSHKEISMNPTKDKKLVQINVMTKAKDKLIQQLQLVSNDFPQIGYKVDFKIESENSYIQLTFQNQLTENKEYEQLQVELIFCQTENLFIKSYQARSKIRMQAKCNQKIPDIDIYQLIRQWILQEQSIKELQNHHEFEYISECVHCDSVNIIKSFYSDKIHLNRLALSIPNCLQLQQNLKLNRDYLRLTPLDKLYQLHIVLQEGLDHALEYEIVQIINRNPNINTVRLFFTERLQKDKQISSIFLKIKNLVCYESVKAYVKMKYSNPMLGYLLDL